MLINLKPHGERDASAAQAIIARLQQRSAQTWRASRCIMQPVQDLTIEDRVSRTQYQFSLTSPDERTARAVERRAGRAPAAAAGARPTSPATCRTRACRRTCVIDRDAAAAWASAWRTSTDALYDAFGQRQISTIFTQASQYRVVLEAQSGRGVGPEALDRIHVKTADGTQVPLSAWRASSSARRSWRSTTSASSRR